MRDPSGSESNGPGVFTLESPDSWFVVRMDFENSRLSHLLVLFWSMKSYIDRPVFACRHWLKKVADVNRRLRSLTVVVSEPVHGSRWRLSRLPPFDGRQRPENQLRHPLRSALAILLDRSVERILDAVFTQQLLNSPSGASGIRGGGHGP